MKNTAKSILQELNKKYNVPDSKIAWKMGVASITIYRWRFGKFNPSFAELKLLQRILRGYKNISNKRRGK